MSSSCCAGKCGCGTGCKCGSSCQGCKMYPDISYSESTNDTRVLLSGLAPQIKYFEYGEAAENGGPNSQCEDKLHL